MGFTELGALETIADAVELDKVEESRARKSMAECSVFSGGFRCAVEKGTQVSKCTTVRGVGGVRPLATVLLSDFAISFETEEFTGCVRSKCGSEVPWTEDDTESTVAASSPEIMGIRLMRQADKFGIYEDHKLNFLHGFRGLIASVDIVPSDWRTEQRELETGNIDTGT